jgi:hypothetical protein
MDTHRSMSDIGRLKERLARNEAFWVRGPAERPLIGMSVNITFPTVTFGNLKAETGRMAPGMIDPEAFLLDWDKIYEHTEARDEDVFMAACPYSGVPWMEAIAGCEVYFSPASHSIWAEHPNPSWESLKQVGFDPNNPWLLKFVECTAVLREHANGRYPIGTPIMRGVSDMAAALLGPQRMVFELLDHPEQSRELFDRLTEIWQGVGTLLTNSRGLFLRGQCAGRRRVWTQGTCMLYQDDAVALLSPTLYEEHFVPRTHRILGSYDRSMIHTHSGSLRVMMAGLLALDSLDAVEVIIDPSGPSVPELIPAFKRIQEHKSLLIVGDIKDMSLNEIHLLLEELSPEGLAIFPKVDTEQEADAVFDQVMSYCGRD